MTFSPSQYRLLKSRLTSRYEKEFKSILVALKKAPASELKSWILENKTELAEVTSLKWLFVKQVQTYLFFASAIPKLSLNQGEEFNPLEDEVFEKWNQSEFADVFLKALNKGQSLQKASIQALKVLEEHLVTLAHRQIQKNYRTHKNYRPQTSLGDFTKQGKLLRLLETTLHLEGKELNLMTPNFKEMKNFSHRIEIATKVIRKFSPSSWERFSAFTDLIIPIKQKEFVSYSHQELPGVSMINLYHRDFVDLLDDLLHENGHHHLNYYLNTGTLIKEPPEAIYYSPWRRTLRPLRGIYHAYFTFFWAFKFFSELSAAKEQDSIWYLFSVKEKEKIIWRAVEEYWMLEYVYQDLKTAKAEGLINETGWKLIQEQRKELLKFKKKIPLWEKKLKTHRQELKDLKKVLKENS